MRASGWISAAGFTIHWFQIMDLILMPAILFRNWVELVLSMERQKATLQELMTVVKDMLRNTEVAVRSFMILQPRFSHQNKAAATSATQSSGAIVPRTSTAQAAANSIVPVFDFYSGLPKKPSPFLQQTVARFEKDLSQYRQWIEELEQLLLLDSEKNSFNQNSSLLQSLPKVMENVHGFFIHVASKKSDGIDWEKSEWDAEFNCYRINGVLFPVPIQAVRILSPLPSPSPPPSPLPSPPSYPPPPTPPLPSSPPTPPLPSSPLPSRKKSQEEKQEVKQREASMNEVEDCNERRTKKFKSNLNK